MRVETLIVAAEVAALAAFLALPVVVSLSWIRASNPRPRVPLRARYRRGRHQAARAPWLARLADAYLTGAREYAAASALLKGAEPWQPA